MPIPYAERKKRRQALRQELPRLALRHVEAVAKLDPEAQRTLGKALAAGLRCIPEHSLFPLSLLAQNVIALEAGSFLPGDLVGVTVVIASRPQAPATPGFPSGLGLLPPTPQHRLIRLYLGGQVR